VRATVDATTTDDEKLKYEKVLAWLRAEIVQCAPITDTHAHNDVADDDEDDRLSAHGVDFDVLRLDRDAQQQQQHGTAVQSTGGGMCTDMGDSDTHDNGDHNERELRDITHETADVSAVHNINADNDDDAQRDTDTPALPPLFASAEMLAHVTLTRRGGGRRRRHSRLAVGDDDSSGSSSNNADDGEHTAHTDTH
jgi:hypothetical protein